jgi:hypothetical protein
LHQHLDQSEVNVHAKLLHFSKIAKSDAVCLIEPTYIGSSTKQELLFAEQLGLDLVNFTLTDYYSHTGVFGDVRTSTMAFDSLADFESSYEFTLFKASNDLGFAS